MFHVRVKRKGFLLGCSFVPMVTRSGSLLVVPVVNYCLFTPDPHLVPCLWSYNIPLLAICLVVGDLGGGMEGPWSRESSFFWFWRAPPSRFLGLRWPCTYGPFLWDSFRSTRHLNFSLIINFLKYLGFIPCFVLCVQVRRSYYCHMQSGFVYITYTCTDVTHIRSSSYLSSICHWRSTAEI